MEDSPDPEDPQGWSGKQRGRGGPYLAVTKMDIWYHFPGGGAEDKRGSDQRIIQTQRDSEVAQRKEYCGASRKLVRKFVMVFPNTPVGFLKGNNGDLVAAEPNTVGISCRRCLLPFLLLALSSTCFRTAWDDPRPPQSTFPCNSTRGGEGTTTLPGSHVSGVLLQ